MLKKSLVGVGVILLLAVAAWWLGWFAKKVDPKVAELQKMIQTPPEVQASLTEQQRKEGGEIFRKKVESLNDEQRKTFFEGAMPFFMSAMAKGASEFRHRIESLSPAERQKELDKAIDMMAGWGKQNQGGGAPPSAKDMDAFRKKMLDWTTPGQRDDMATIGELIKERRQQRGLPDLPGGGFF
jgi:hypothetical protein